jgi:hypothetical protein
MGRRFRRIALLLTALSGVRAPPAAAHPAPFSYLDLRLDGRRLEGTLVIHDLDAARELGLDAPEAISDPQVAASCRNRLVELLEARLRIWGDGGALSLRWGAIAVLSERKSVSFDFYCDPPAPALLRLEAALFPRDPNHQTFINLYEGESLRHQAILSARRTTMEYYAGTLQGRLALVKTFVPAGIRHILIGPDHVLFLLGLLLLGGSFARLAGIVTAFTLGHSITLSLATLGVLAPSAALVEPSIALTIIVVGMDNLLVGARRSVTAGVSRAAPNRPFDLRPWLAAVFGLIHGFGFALVLQEFGLPRSSLGWSLLSFNVGVEIGQLAIVAVLTSSLALLRRRSALLSGWVAFGGSIGVVIAGGYWFVERLWFTGGTS